MSIEIINQAYQATSTIDDAIVEVCVNVRSHSYNGHGVIRNPALLIDDLKRGAQRFLELAALAENTQWPTDTDYGKV